MDAHMKTTLHISDALLNRAEEVASRERTTLREPSEEGLRHVLEGHQTQRQGFRLRQVTFRGQGFRAEIAGASWDRIRDLAYSGRGRSTERR